MIFLFRFVHVHLLMLTLLICIVAGCASVDDNKPHAGSTRVICTDASHTKVTCPQIYKEEKLREIIAAFPGDPKRDPHLRLQRRDDQTVPSGSPKFFDALNRFKKYVIPESLKRESTYWLDNERIAFSSREYPGWKAKPEELSRIISYNIVTGEIVDSGYRGRLLCLNHLGDLLVGQPDKGSGDALKLKDFHWLSGKWGQPLRSIEYLENPDFVSYHCGFIPYGDPIYRYPSEELKSDAAKVTPLMPEHGAIKETVVRVNGQLQNKVVLIKPNGETVQISNRRPNHFQFIFQPWDESYFEVNTAPVEPRVFYPSGKIVSHPAPPFHRLEKNSSFVCRPLSKSQGRFVEYSTKSQGMA